MSPMPKKGAIERNVKKEIKRILDKHGWYWWCPPANAYGKSGISDFHALKNGVFMAIESKRGKAGLKETQPTQNQIAFLNSVRAAQGTFAFVVYESRLEHLDAFLGAFHRAAVARKTGQPVADEDGAMMMNCTREMTLELGSGS